MPTYQYRCTECGHDLEAVQKFTDSALTECPNCGGQLRKVFNAVGVVFKGSGFYRNDSRSPDKNAREGAGEKADSKESGGKESGGKESGGRESSAPVKEKAGPGAEGASSGKEAAKPAASGSTNSSSSGSSTATKAAAS